MLQQPTSSTFIGRRAELDGLQQRLRATEQGQGSTVLVSGEAGIGKSRLVAEVASLSTLVLRGHCFEPDSSLPFAPVVDLLRARFSSLPADDVTALLMPHRAEIARLLPELVSPASHPTNPAVDSDWDKHRLFHALDGLIADLAGSSPVLIVIEDLHWSDDTSLEYLLHLARQVQDLSVLLLLTYRADEVQPGLRHLLAALDRERLAVEVSLAPLTVDEVDAMLRAIFQQSQPIRSDFLHELYALTEGNAFFVEEIIGALISSGDIYRTADRWDRKALPDLRIPRSVQHAVIRRTEGLGAESVQLLRLAAVAGQRFSFTVLQTLTGLDERAMIVAIRELIGANLIVEESADSFRFRHALIRQAIYGDLLERERRLMHRTIGETIESLDAGRASDIAYHFHAAGEWAKALQYAPLAGFRALELHTPRAAIAHFGRAVDAARFLDVGLDAGFYRAQGLAHATLGEFDLAREAFEQVLEIATGEENRSLEWQALYDLADLWLGYNYESAGRFSTDALLIAQDLDDDLQVARSLVQMGNWQVNTEQPLDAARSLAAALAIFEQHDDRHEIARTLDLMGVVADISGDLSGMRHYLERALPLCQELENRQGEASILTNLTCVAGVGVYDISAIPTPISLEDITERINEALKIAREIDWRSGEAYALALLALHHTHRGILGDAQESSGKAHAIAEDIEHREWLTAIFIERGLRYLALLHLAESRAAFEQAHLLAESSGSLMFIRLAAGMLASVCVYDGDFETAASILDRFDQDLPTTTVGERWVWFARAELARALGAPDRALNITTRLFSSAAGLAGPEQIPRLALLQGGCLVDLGRYAEAEDMLLAGCDGAERYEMRPVLWRIRMALGRLCRVLDRLDEAALQLDRARTVVDEMAATLFDDALRSAFVSRALQPSAINVSDASERRLDRLTAREHDVALLVARGMTNKDIAAALFVGERTVETHVSNILGKLGFSTRTQVAAWVLESGLTHVSDAGQVARSPSSESP